MYKGFSGITMGNLALIIRHWIQTVKRLQIIQYLQYTKADTQGDNSTVQPSKVKIRVNWFA